DRQSIKSVQQTVPPLLCLHFDRNSSKTHNIISQSHRGQRKNDHTRLKNGFGDFPKSLRRVFMSIYLIIEISYKEIFVSRKLWWKESSLLRNQLIETLKADGLYTSILFKT